MQLALELDGQCVGPLFGPLPITKGPMVFGSRLPGTHRRRHERRAIPGWALKSDIGVFYRLARIATKATGVRWSVDHIVPLRHPLVCGLHCPDNLTLRPLAENVLKGNGWWPNMPVEQVRLL